VPRGRQPLLRSFLLRASLRYHGQVVEPAVSWATSFLSLRQFVDETYGPGSFRKLREALQRQHDIVLPPSIELGTWLPTVHLVTAYATAATLFETPDFHARLGWAAAAYELTWLQRLAMRFTSPQFFLERGAQHWRNRHSTGTWTYDARPRWIRGTLRDFVVDAGFCTMMRAWLTHACVMTGAGKIYIVERACRSKGADACVFEGNW
jgi:hypothetical protein